MAWFFGKKRPPLYAAIDAGSHSIKAIIFESAKDGKPPKVLKKLVLKLPYASDTERVIQRLREMLFAVVKELERVPARIAIALGPSIAPHTLEVWEGAMYSGRVSFRDLETYYATVTAAHQEPGFSLLAYPLEILANGYSAAVRSGGVWRRVGPDGAGTLKNSSEDFLALPDKVRISFRSLVLKFPAPIWEHLTNLRQTFGGMPIEFLPLLSAVRAVVPKFFSVPETFFIDVGGEETVLSFVRGPELCGVKSFHVGGRHFQRGIARAGGFSFDEAEDLERQYSDINITDEKKELVKGFVGKEVDFWKNNFRETLDSFYQLGPFPVNAFLYGGGANVSDIVEYLRAGTWIEDFSYSNKAVVRPLAGSDFFEGSTLKGFLRGPDEVGLAALIHYLELS